MAFKNNIFIVLGFSLVILVGCTFPLLGATPTVTTAPPATVQLPTAEVIQATTEAVLNTLSVPVATVTNTIPPPPTSTVAPTLRVVPVLKWNLIGVGCLSTTNIEITLTVGVPATSIQSVCAGPAPCTSSSPIKYSCQLVPNKDGQVYCYGLHADAGSGLIACLVLPGITQPVCNTFDDFQHYLAPCKCVSLYSTLASCNADTKCAWNAITLKCAAKP